MGMRGAGRVREEARDGAKQQDRGKSWQRRPEAVLSIDGQGP